MDEYDLILELNFINPNGKIGFEKGEIDWFINPIPSPYMSFALKYKKKALKKVPAVIHHDGTGRLQTVNKKLSPWFHRFLLKWEAKTGVPIIINTSFKHLKSLYFLFKM
jgi:predicted NodU family carbamoyl transferase